MTIADGDGAGTTLRGPYSSAKLLDSRGARETTDAARQSFLELAVLASVPFGAPYRILARIDAHFAACSGDCVDAEHIREPCQIKQDIGDFFGDRALATRIEVRTLRRRQPLELLEQFGRLDAERDRQIFWRMKLFPVA